MAVIPHLMTQTSVTVDDYSVRSLLQIREREMTTEGTAKSLEQMMAPFIEDCHAREQEIAAERAHRETDIVVSG